MQPRHEDILGSADLPVPIRCHRDSGLDRPSTRVLGCSHLRCDCTLLSERQTTTEVHPSAALVAFACNVLIKLKCAEKFMTGGVVATLIIHSLWSERSNSKGNCTLRDPWQGASFRIVLPVNINSRSVDPEPTEYLDNRLVSHPRKGFMTGDNVPVRCP